MADAIDFKILGDDLQLVEVELDPGEGVRAEIGTMTYMEDGIDMQTSTDGGILQGLKRAIVGESFFITNFSNQGPKRAKVGFAAPYPGKIVPLDLGAVGGNFICQKDSFLCAARGVEIEIAFTKKIGAGLFGGEGFILEKLSGDGMAFVHAGGTVIERDLAAGETLRVDTGCLVAFAPTIEYDIKFVGGFKNTLFGGEGLFFATLTGPGKVYLQSLPLSRLVDRIASAVKRQIGEKPGAAGFGSDTFGKIISGG
jgi:uncharacterized protein (TIGR00266 family)